MGYTSKKGVIGFPWMHSRKNETTRLADENVISSLATAITAAATIAAAILVAISARQVVSKFEIHGKTRSSSDLAF